MSDFEQWWAKIQAKQFEDSLRVMQEAQNRVKAAASGVTLPSVYEYRREDLLSMGPGHPTSGEIEAWAQMRNDCKEREKKMCLLAIKAGQEQACLDDLEFFRQCGITQDVCWL